MGRRKQNSSSPCRLWMLHERKSSFHQETDSGFACWALSRAKARFIEPPYLNAAINGRSTPVSLQSTFHRNRRSTTAGRDQGLPKSPADAGFVRWGTQMWHLARIFTVDNSEIEELNSFRRVSTLNEMQSVQPWG